MSSPLRSSLRVPGFAPLAASYALNELGDNLGVVALAVLVLDRTDSALATTALFLAARFLPALIAPALTAGLDHRPIGRVLPALYIVEAGAFVALAQFAPASHFWLPAVLALAFADGLLALTARALSRGAVAGALAPAGLLREGNSVLNIAFAVTSVAGPVLAGLLIDISGVGLALWLDAVSFFGVAVLLTITARKLPSPAPSSGERWHRRLKSGVRYIRGHPFAGRLVTGQGVAILFFALVVPIEVVYAKETLDTTSLGYGALLTTWGVGILLGSALFSVARERPVTSLVLGSTLLIGVGYAGMAVAPTLAIACVSSIVGGIGNGVQTVAVMTALQEAVSDEYQARAAGLLESVGAAVPGLGFLIGGVLAAAVSPRLAFAVAALGVVAVVLVWARRPLVPARVPA